MPETEVAAPKTIAPTLDGYDGLKFALPNGKVVMGKVLPLARATHYLRMAAQEDAKQRRANEDTIIQEFPKEVGLEAELNQLTLPEFWEAFWCFFARRVTPAETNGQHPAPTGAIS